jgi:predicted enzyme related to lactoylglutathione lyase
MKRNPVDWFEIYVEDMARARKFYEAVLEVKLSPLENAGAQLCTFPMEPNGSGAAGALVKMQGFASGANSTLVYFQSQDCSIEEKRASDFGGRVQKSKQSIGEHGFISLVIDTEGNMFGLHSMK